MESSSSSSSTQPPVTDTNAEQAAPTKLVDVAVTDENVALNLIVSFVSLAQKRGAFNIEESSKIWECIKRFQK